jgi:transcriptional regulator with XRE-family HTH domain
MMSIQLTLSEAIDSMRFNIKSLRLSFGLTQDGLAKRSGVPLPTLRKYEKTGLISLESLFKLLLVLGGLENIIDAVKGSGYKFNSLDEIIKLQKKDEKAKKSQRKYGWIN